MRLSSWKLEAIAPVAGASRARLPVQSRRIRGNIRLAGTLQRKHALFSKHYLKWLLRSRSPQLTRDRDPSRYVPSTVSTFRRHGRKLHYRPGSSDPEVIYKILLRRGAKAEYYIPEAFNPRSVWDIGANIGAASLYFSECYPQAEIHCFEPMPENHAMIARNIEGLDRIRLHPFALGEKEGMLEIRASDSASNLGGFSFHDAGTSKAPGQKVRVRTPRTVIEDGTAPPPELIKIDVEGAEYDILAAFEPRVLERVRWITGELHGNRSFELLEFLSRWFDIGTRKTLGKRLFNFLARNRSV